MSYIATSPRDLKVKLEAHQRDYSHRAEHPLQFEPGPTIDLIAAGDPDGSGVYTVNIGEVSKRVLDSLNRTGNYSPTGLSTRSDDGGDYRYAHRYGRQSNRPVGQTRQPVDG